MDKGAGVRGADVPIGKLVPLHERRVRKESAKRLLSSIRAVGLIEPLAVFPEGEKYVILDGYLRYRACLELGVAEVPCLLLSTKEAYTPNRMVNHLSGVQEHRMITQALGAVGEERIAKALGVSSVRHRLKAGIVRQLHPDVIRAFDERGIPLSRCARDLTFVKPEYQLTMLREMEGAGDFSSAFARTLILRAPETLRNEQARGKPPWRRGEAEKEALASKLEEAERRSEFYAGLYRQYVADLLKLCVYVRRLVTNRGIADRLKERHPDVLDRFRRIVFETEGTEATGGPPEGSPGADVS
jgi:ParB-like chromosome segregation protein Spo0J